MCSDEQTQLDKKRKTVRVLLSPQLSLDRNKIGLGRGPTSNVTLKSLTFGFSSLYASGDSVSHRESHSTFHLSRARRDPKRIIWRMLRRQGFIADSDLRQHQEQLPSRSTDHGCLLDSTLARGSAAAAVKLCCYAPFPAVDATARGGLKAFRWPYRWPNSTTTS